MVLQQGARISKNMFMVVLLSSLVSVVQVCAIGQE